MWLMLPEWRRGVDARKDSGALRGNSEAERQRVLGDGDHDGRATLRGRRADVMADFRTAEGRSGCDDDRGEQRPVFAARQSCCRQS